MKKKLLLIIPAVFLLVVIGLVIYWNPPTTTVSYKFDAVKMDANGNVLGNFTIELSGTRIEPYFENPRLDLTMTPFDGQSDLVTESDSAKFPGAEIRKHSRGEFLTIDCCVFDRTENYYRFVELCFSPDFDRWVYHDIDDDVFYVGSVSGQYINEELLGYFRLGDSSKSMEFPRSLTKVDQEGNASLDFQLNIEGSVGESPDGTAWLRAKIESFDGITDIETVNDSDSDLPEIQTLPSMELQFIICSGLDGGKPATVNLYFSPGLERWMFYNVSDKTYFVGSVGDKYTTQELYEYFSPMIVGYWYAE